MNDQSYLDERYFTGSDTYNCPFCNRRQVHFRVTTDGNFMWSNDREVFYYVVECASCENESFHLSDYEFVGVREDGFYQIEDNDHEIDEDIENLDQYFFFHKPTSFFTVDSRIPRKVRELISEADGCRKMNFNVGASGALRKAIYEFLLDREADQEQSYEEQIKTLKQELPTINDEYFDVLANIQDMTSENLHEQRGDWQPWGTEDLEFLTKMFRELMVEIYVIPDERKQQFDEITRLKNRSSFQEEDSG